MPMYNFKNNETNETFTAFFTISGKEDYLANNPHITQELSTPLIVSGVDNINRLDGDYKDLIRQVKKNNLHSTIDPP